MLELLQKKHRFTYEQHFLALLEFSDLLGKFSTLFELCKKIYFEIKVCSVFKQVSRALFLKIVAKGSEV